MTGAAPDPVDAYVGARLRALRQARGLSQSALGGALGVSFQQVQKYEQGTNRVAASTLVRAADLLGVSPADILPPRPAGTARDLAALGFAEQPDATAVISAWPGLTRRQQAEVAQLVLNLAQKNADRGRP